MIHPLYVQSVSHLAPTMEGLTQSRNDSESSAVLDAGRAAQKAQQVAHDLRRQASEALNPEEKQRLLLQSRKKFVEARKCSKKAHRLASGAWQGGTRGAGIGAAVGMGLGTVIGTLVGTLVSIPTTGLGVLVGVPVGWLHGPWVKITGKEGEDGSSEQGNDKVGEDNDDHQGPETTDDDLMDEQGHFAVLAAVAAAEDQERKAGDPMTEP
jgi:hypothetical protein